MSPEALESLIAGARETDSLEFKSAVPWNVNTFVKDILALANVIDGGVIIVGVGEEDGNFVRQGLSAEQIATYNYDIMRDQIAPYADPRVIFTKDAIQDAGGLSYVVIEVAPFEELPVLCIQDGPDNLQAGTLYFRSRSRRPQSARVSRAEDMREIVEAAISRRWRNMRRLGFAGESEGQHALDAELGDL